MHDDDLTLLVYITDNWTEAFHNHNHNV